MIENNTVNRRKVLKSVPVIVGTSAGCTGNQQETTPTATPTPTTQPPTPTEATPEPQAEQTPTSQPGYEDVLAELTENAQEEGTVFIRKPGRSNLTNIVGEILEERTGITFQTSGGSREKHIAQSATEIEVGKLRADVIETTDPSERLLAIDQNVIQENALPPSAEFGRISDRYTPEWDQKGRWLLVSTAGQVLAYNTDLVAEEDVPKTYDEMLDPQWENSFLIDIDADSLLYLLTHVKGSWDAAVQWIEEFEPQIKNLNSSSFSSTVDVGEGKAKFFINAPSSLVREIGATEDLPLGLVFPNNIAFLEATGLGIFKDPPHPDAAELFLEIATSKEAGERYLNELYDYPMDPDLWPEELQNADEVITVDLGFIVSILQESGLTADEIYNTYSSAIGAPSI